MTRRPLLVVTLSFVTLALAACSDVTGPTTSERQVGASTSTAVRSCPGGYSTSTGKCS